MFVGSSRNVEGFSWVGVDDYAGVIETAAGINGDDVEKLADGVGVEIFIPEDAFKADGFVAFGGSFEEEVVASFLNFEELVSTLFSESQFNFVPFLIPDIVGLTIDNFKLVFTWANFLDHPELTEVVLVGLGAYNSGFIVFLVIVGGNSEGLVTLLADNLVDVTSGECKNSFHFFDWDLISL